MSHTYLMILFLDFYLALSLSNFFIPILSFDVVKLHSALEFDMANGQLR